jgi:hypothetical protein
MTGTFVEAKLLESITELTRPIPPLTAYVIELDIAGPVAVVVQYWRTRDVGDELPFSGWTT